jgi:hypothetical protein
MNTLPTQICTDRLNYTSALNKIKEKDQIELAQENAESVIKNVITSFNQFYSRNNTKGPIGLVYGRIQSGKTRTMVMSAALAADNGFKIIIVITTNNTPLVKQTQNRFYKELLTSHTIDMITESDLEDTETAMNILDDSPDTLLLVCSKGVKVLEKVCKFLTTIYHKNYPTIIFDDEGDQGSLDTNTRKRSEKDEDIDPSKTFALIHNGIRDIARRNVFVSVTGTPQSIVLQNIELRPSFTQILKTSTDYIGGDIFFADEQLDDNKLIREVDFEEKNLIVDNAPDEPPKGLREAVITFFLLATQASLDLGWNDGYDFLCHPSLKISDQEKAEDMICTLINEIRDALKDRNPEVRAEIESEYSRLLNEGHKLSTFREIAEQLIAYIHKCKRILINARTTKTEKLKSTFYNLFIGGNTLGRGITIDNLLVTYYVREAKTSQMDTMYQHARIFGYRKKLLPYTKVFLTQSIYEKFHNIYESDEELRKLIEKHGEELKALPVSIFKGIIPTRRNVLDAINNNTIRPDSLLYPNLSQFENPEASTNRNNVYIVLKRLIPTFDPDNKDQYKKNKQLRNLGEIPCDDAVKILKSLPTNATNKWSDHVIPSLLKAIKHQNGDGVIVKFRTSNRNANPDGSFPTGTIGGYAEEREAHSSKPVLWLIEVNGRGKNLGGIPFLHQTIITPKTMQIYQINTDDR